MGKAKGHRARRPFTCGRCGNRYTGHQHVSVVFGVVCRLCFRKQDALGA